MVEHATIEDRKFVFIKDIDGNDAPIYIGSIVAAINSGVVPGFSILNESETEIADKVLADAEHHHRYEMFYSPNAPKQYKEHIPAEKAISWLRKRLRLPIHQVSPDHCPYLRPQILNPERVGI